MQTVQQGDRVQVHYVIRSQDGSVASSHGQRPLELTVGVEHPRLPGLGLALVGLTTGACATLRVPPEKAYGMADPARVHRLARSRFPESSVLTVGKFVRISDRKGRRRLVRVLEAGSKAVVVDSNHRWAGQALELQVELISIQTPDAPSDLTKPIALA
ncbi:MAG TPA: FKBP-type peptidyl-prolyl cis-trans isomerase [Gemmataceae bacterium]|nr:FKBP-type peptidyl-prolyl cis-trans isomerase [Gemmataceae bacterium]